VVVNRGQRGEITLDRTREVIVIRRLLDDTQARFPAGAVATTAGVAKLRNARPFGSAQERRRRNEQYDRKRAHASRILTA